MKKILKIVMDPKAMSLSILPNNITKMHSELFKYMVTVARVIFAAKWKAEKCLGFKEWKTK